MGNRYYCEYRLINKNPIDITFKTTTGETTGSSFEIEIRNIYNGVESRYIEIGPISTIKTYPPISGTSITFIIKGYPGYSGAIIDENGNTLATFDENSSYPLNLGNIIKGHTFVTVVINA